MDAHIAGEPVVFRIDGVFDVPAAQRLASALADVDGTDVRIDLTQVREFHDFGVAVLAQALASQRVHAAVSGLRQHHVRLLRYLGIETARGDGRLEAEAV